MDRGIAPANGGGPLGLARLLASRLSHDLGDPVLGLVAALGEAAGDGDTLVPAQHAALVVQRRLALFRAAWGSDPAPLRRGTLKELAAGLPNAQRLRLECDALDDAAPFDPDSGQVVTSAMLLAAESLPQGGVLALAGEPRGVVLVTIAGQGAAWPTGLGAMLASAEAAWDGVTTLAASAGRGSLPGAMTALLAHRAGVRAALLLAGRAEPVPPLLLDVSARHGA